VSAITTITVGMGELEISQDPNSVLVTYALGSCIAVIVYDRVRRVGGMIHYMLPLSSVTPERSRERPAMFADTGVPLLLDRMYARACKRSDLVVKVAGGASIQDDAGYFEIGKRNYLALRKLIWKAGLPIAAEAVGGHISRTVRLFIGNGRATLRASNMREDVEL